jgi:hypothetical protein
METALVAGDWLPSCELINPSLGFHTNIPGKNAQITL